MTSSKVFVRGFLILFLLAGLLAGALLPTFAPVKASAPRAGNASHIVISEFRTRGPNGGNDEFVEIYNPMNTPADVSGWLFRTSSSSGTKNTRYIFPPLTTIPPNQYYLLVNSSASAGLLALANGTYSTGIADDGGMAITLADGTTIIDQVGMSVAPSYIEGTTPLPQTTTNKEQSYERKLTWMNGNCIDSDKNISDFSYNDGTSNPQNLSSSAVACGAIPSPRVIISEVAWAGTLASPDDEWIELYNPGVLDVDLTGWRLVTDSGHVDVILNGTIAAGGFFLLERAHDNTVNDLPADQIYFGALSDTGETLRLRMPDGTSVDTANASGGSWPAGSVSPNGSMERYSAIAPDDPSGWATNLGTVTWNGRDAANNPIHGTPKQANWAFFVTPTLTPTITPSATITPSPTRTPTASPTLTPTPSASRTVLINEVAWMGTIASSSDEWIELYNTTNQDINLAGWRLVASDGNPSINLSGVIAADGFLILETSSSVFSNLPPTIPTFTFTGTLNNAGEILRLYDPANTIIDTANSDGGSWPAGLASPGYQTMERRANVADSATAWVTYAGSGSIVRDRGNNVIRGTPGDANWATTVTVTPSPKPTATKKRVTPSPTPFAHVVINEFLPRPGFDWNNDGEVNVYDEFIEIENLGPINVNLSGWKLDDEPNIGSSPFTLPSKTLKPGERAIFFGSQTHILLDDSGDEVRLINSRGVVVDARGYTVIKYPDQSICRIPDGMGYWRFPCFPTPGNENSLTGSVPSSPSGKATPPPSCLFADTTPLDFVNAECHSFGADMWSHKYWDDQAGPQNEILVPDDHSKWQTFVQ